MKTRLALLLHALFAAPAVAEPCVGLLYDRPLPGAVDVTMHHVDVPAAHFPGIWQDGMIDGHFYQVFANRLAVLQAERTAPAWSINVNCQQRPCTITGAGSPPATATNTAKRLEQCLVPPEIKVVASPEEQKLPAAKAPSKPAAAKAAPQEPAPEKAAPAKPAPKVKAIAPALPALKPNFLPKADPAAKPGIYTATGPGNLPLAAKPGNVFPKPTTLDARNLAPSGHVSARTGNVGAEMTCPPPLIVIPPVVPSACRSAVIPESDPVATLQQLLVMAGTDPGDVDGRYGSRTKEAVLEVLGYRGRNLNVSEAIAAIDAFLCDQEN